MLRISELTTAATKAPQNTECEGDQLLPPILILEAFPGDSAVGMRPLLRTLEKRGIQPLVVALCSASLPLQAPPGVTLPEPSATHTATATPADGEATNPLLDEARIEVSTTIGTHGYRLGVQPESLISSTADSRAVYGEETVVFILSLMQAIGAVTVCAPSLAEPLYDRFAVGLAAYEATRRFGPNCALAFYGVDATVQATNDADRANLYRRELSCLETAEQQPHPGAASTPPESIAIRRPANEILPVYGLSSASRWFEAPGGETGPLVSVIVRSTGRAELMMALDSIAGQTYGIIEVIVVDVLGTDKLALSDRCGRFTLRTVGSGQHLQRAAAANVGLDAVHGDCAYVLLLDDDDWLFPDHVQALLDGVRNSDDARAAYAGIICVEAVPNGDLKEIYKFNEAYDPTRLLLENYLPIHAVFFARTLLGERLRFDESLELYEDWDFWIQLSLLTSIAHVDGVTGVYRISTGSGFGVSNDDPGIAPGRRAVIDKWRKRWSLDQLMDMVEYARFRPSFEHAQQYTSSPASSDGRTSAKKARREPKGMRGLDQEIKSLRNVLSGLNAQMGKVLLLKTVAPAVTAPSPSHSDLSRLHTGLETVQQLLAALALSDPDAAAELIRNLSAAPATSSLPTPPEPLLSGEDACTRGWRERQARANAAHMPIKRLIAPHRFARRSWLEARRLKASGLIDTDWYRREYPDVTRAAAQPALHYVRYGWREGRQPNPLFDTDWYLQQNSDVWELGVNPLSHYLYHGTSEGRFPNPLFDTRWYLQQNPDVQKAGMNPLYHYLHYGAEEGRSPHPLFDTRWYLEQNPDVQKAGINPLYHYLHSGAAEGRSPHPLFDGRRYIRLNANLAAARANPLAHYLGASQKAEQSPHELFDTGWYLNTYPDVALSGANPLVHFLEQGAALGYAPNPAFDTGWYREQHLRDHPNTTNPLVHFVLSGRQQGLATCPAVLEVAEVAEAAPVPKAGEQRRPTVLIIDSIWPQPDRDSGSMDMMHTIDCFQALGYHVRFAADSEFEIENDYRRTLESRDVQCLSKAQCSSITAFIEARGAEIDLYFLSRVHSGGRYFELVRRCAGAAHVIFSTVDLHFVREVREAAVREDRAAGVLAAETRERELYLTRQADATIVVSEQDKRQLESLVPGAMLYEMPLVRECVDSVPPFDARWGIGFVGSYQHTPNVDAVRYLISDLWPLIRTHVPYCELYLAGSDLPADIRSKLPDGVTYLGYVSDLDAWFDCIRLTIAPLRYGAGAKGKVASSLAHGVPCTATPIAAEGMRLIDGIHLRIAEDAQTFAQAVAELYQEPELWQRYSEAGLSFATQHLSEEAGLHRFASMLHRLELLPDPTAWRPDGLHTKHRSCV